MSARRMTGLGLAALMSAGMLQAAFAAQSAEDIAAAHVAAKGYTAVDLGKLEQDLDRTLRATGDTGDMIPKDVDLSPIEKALLLVDLEEKPINRLRYVLRYGQQLVGEEMVSFVDVERYNLGPAIRKDAIDSYGAENVGDAAVFGIGPHVAWRFVTQQTVKSAALLLAASRREISDEEAGTRDCLPRTCLSFETLDELATWKEASPPAEMPQVAYTAVLKSGAGDEIVEEVSPAMQAVQLGLAADIAELDGDSFGWTLPDPVGPPSDKPYLVMLIDRNLGQDIMSDAAVGIAKLDKDHDQRWARLSGGIFDGKAQQTVSTAKGPLRKR